MKFKGRHKYRAKPQVTEDGRFDSKRELARWEQLKLLEQAETISNLNRNRKDCTFVLHGVNGSPICKYIADFLYDENGQSVAEDSKGFKTDAYRIKRKLFIAEYGKAWEHRES